MMNALCRLHFTPPREMEKEMVLSRGRGLSGCPVPASPRGAGPDCRLRGHWTPRGHAAPQLFYLTSPKPQVPKENSVPIRVPGAPFGICFQSWYCADGGSGARGSWRCCPSVSCRLQPTRTPCPVPVPDIRPSALPLWPHPRCRAPPRLGGCHPPSDSWK